MAPRKAKKKIKAIEPVTNKSDIDARPAAPPTPSSAPHHKRGIYRRVSRTIPIQSHVDAQEMIASLATAFDPLREFAEIAQVCGRVVAAAVERNREAIEADLTRRREMLDGIGRLTIKRAKELNVEHLRRNARARRALKADLTFERWRADALRGLNGSMGKPFVADATDQERDAHEVLRYLDQLREMENTGGSVNAERAIILRLGRVVERFNVRPFEPLVEVTLNKRDGVRRDRDRRHGTPEDRDDLKVRVRDEVDRMREDDRRNGKKPRSVHRCCKILVKIKADEFKQPNGKPYGHDALRKMYGPVLNRPD